MHPGKPQPRPAQQIDEDAAEIRERGDTRAGESLREAEQKFQAIFDNTSDGIFLQDLETRKFTMCNKSCSQMLGYTEEEFTRLSIADIHLKADLPFIYSQIEEFLKGGKPIRHDIRFKRKDGSILLADVSPDLIQLEGKRYVVVALKDITERKRMEEELRRHAGRLEELVAARTGELQESETRYRSLYHTIADGIFVIGVDGQVHDVNDSACAQLGYTREELVGMPISAISARSDFNLGEIFDRLRAAGSLSFETAHRRKDGVIVPVELSVTLVEYRGQPEILGVARDITKRQQAEKALRESEERHRRLIENLKGSHFIYVHDTRGVFQYLSESLTDVLGYTPDEFMAHYSKYMTDHPANQAVHAHTELSIQGIRQPAYEVNIWHKDGSSRWLEVQEVPVFDASGKVIAVEGVAQDITERKRAEEALRESERRLKRAQEIAHLGSWELDLTNDHLSWSDEVYRIFGLQPQEFGASYEAFLDCVHPDDRDAVDAAYSGSLREGRDTYEIEHRVVRRSTGEIRVVHEKCEHIRDASGRIIRSIGMVHDITERKRAEESLQFTQFAVDHTADAAFWMTADGRFFYVNEAACQALGYSRDELLDMTVYDIDPAFTESMWRESWHKLKVEKSIVLETVHRARDGRTYPVEIRANYLEFGGREYDCAFARDITERKQAEEALREKDYLLSESQRIGHIGTWSVDLATRITTWTSETYRLFGVSPEAFVPSANALVNLLHPNDRDAMREFIRAVLAGEHPDVLEFRVVLPDGSIRTLSGRGEIIFADGNRPVRLVGTVQDVTEQKQAQAALLESEERYRILLEHGFDGIFVHEDFRIVQLNDRLAEMTGHTREELTGSRIIDLFLPESQERIRQYIRSGATGYFEIELRRRDGSIVEVESFGVPCRFHGRNARIVGLRDITERKRAEEALRESEERFRTAFEEGTVAMALTALDSTLLKVNSSFCRMLGFSESELVGRSFTEITHPDDVAANLVGTERLACGEISSFRMEKRYLRKDGAVVWGDMSTASVRDANGRPLYCVTHIQDVTDRKQAEEALRRLNERLELQVAQRTEELRRMVDRLRQLTLELSQAEDRERNRIADILHEDVQQTLAAARFHLNLLGSGTCGAEESRRIVQQVRQMLRDAIERSRSLSHELSPAIYQVELTEILGWLARHMQRKHGLTVRVEAHGRVDSPSEPLRAFLFKVTQELLFNVVKHAGVREARVRVRRMGQSIYLSVVDQGRGFDPQELEGTAGFGLLSIRERVRLLGGRMKIRSMPGLGTRILIAVPDQGPSGPAAP